MNARVSALLDPTDKAQLSDDLLPRLQPIAERRSSSLYCRIRRHFLYPRRRHAFTLEIRMSWSCLRYPLHLPLTFGSLAIFSYRASAGAALTGFRPFLPLGTFGGGGRSYASFATDDTDDGARGQVLTAKGLVVTGESESTSNVSSFGVARFQYELIFGDTFE
jgi:hypothetical protein